MAVLKNIQEIRVYDLNQPAAQAYCQELERTYKGVRAVTADSVEQAVRGSHVVNVATSGAASPRIEDEWQ